MCQPEPQQDEASPPPQQMVMQNPDGSMVMLLSPENPYRQAAAQEQGGAAAQPEPQVNVEINPMLLQQFYGPLQLERMARVVREPLPPPLTCAHGSGLARVVRPYLVTSSSGAPARPVRYGLLAHARDGGHVACGHRHRHVLQRLPGSAALPARPHARVPDLPHSLRPRARRPRGPFLHGPAARHARPPRAALSLRGCPAHHPPSFSCFSQRRRPPRCQSTSRSRRWCSSSSRTLSGASTGCCPPPSSRRASCTTSRSSTR
jgi:hypothetical protein